MTDCVDKAALVEAEIDRVATEYRESPNLLHVIRTYLRQVTEAMDAVCAVPSFFDLDTAVGDQLTLLGKRMGWPRCHCVCNIQPVFGFACEGIPTSSIVAGFCDDNVTWDACGPFGTSDLCINDDATYRAFLKVRRYQMLNLYDLESLTEAIQTFWGESATVLDAGVGRVVIAPGRELTATEVALLQLYPRVLPVAPGVRIRFHFGPVKVFGFGDGWGGFCEPWVGEGLPLETETGNTLTDENGVDIMTGPLTGDADWMCEVDVAPYDCAS